MIARDLPEVVAAQAIETRVAEVRDQDLVVVEEAYDERGPHAAYWGWLCAAWKIEVLASLPARAPAARRPERWSRDRPRTGAPW
jgi:hypothetical protein